MVRYSPSRFLSRSPRGCGIFLLLSILSRKWRADYNSGMVAKQQFQDPFAKLFGSVARVRLLRLFLFHPKKMFTAPEASERTRVKSVDVRRELKLLLEAGFLRKTSAATPRYGINEKFPFVTALQQMLLLAPLRGSDIPTRLRGCGTFKLVVLAGIFAGNFDGGLDVLIVGDKLNERALKAAIKILEADLGTELKFTTLQTADFTYRLTISDRFVRDIFDYPHRVVFDKLDIGLK